MPILVLAEIGKIEAPTQELLQSCAKAAGDPVLLDVRRVGKIMEASAAESFGARLGYYQSLPGFAREWLREIANETIAATLGLAPLAYTLSWGYKEGMSSIAEGIRKILQGLIDDLPPDVKNALGGRTDTDRLGLLGEGDTPPRTEHAQVLASPKLSIDGFSGQHKSEFRDLLSAGVELHAINTHPDKLDFGPWSIISDESNSDTNRRTKARFRAAARKAATAAGAPCRVNLLDWWISKLARGRKLPYIQGLIQRSAEFCEDLESNAAELRALVDETNTLPGLSRDRYPTEPPVAYWLYAEPHRPLSDAIAEFAYWDQRVWEGFASSVDELASSPRERRRWIDDQGNQHAAPTEDVRDRVRERVRNRAQLLTAWTEGLSYDLAVLQANYAIDRGLLGESAITTFEEEAAEIIERVRSEWRAASKRLGISWRKLESKDIDFATPFREVAADFAFFLGVPGPRAGNPGAGKGAGQTIMPAECDTPSDIPAEIRVWVPTIPSSEYFPTPVVTQQLKFFEQRHCLPEANEGVKSDFRGLAHAAIVAATVGSTVPQAQVDDWLDALGHYGYSWQTMADLVLNSRDHLTDLHRNQLAVGSLEKAQRFEALANKFDQLFARVPVPDLPRLGQDQSGSETVTVARRGRKSKFDRPQLEKARQMKSDGRSNNDVAKILYGPTPTAAQRRSIPTILRHHFGSKK